MEKSGTSVAWTQRHRRLVRGEHRGGALTTAARALATMFCRAGDTARENRGEDEGQAEMQGNPFFSHEEAG